MNHSVATRRIRTALRAEGLLDHVAKVQSWTAVDSRDRSRWVTVTNVFLASGQADFQPVVAEALGAVEGVEEASQTYGWVTVRWAA